jgi:hypothetical protein
MHKIDPKWIFYRYQNISEVILLFKDLNSSHFEDILLHPKIVDFEMSRIMKWDIVIHGPLGNSKLKK